MKKKLTLLMVFIAVALLPSAALAALPTAFETLADAGMTVEFIIGDQLKDNFKVIPSSSETDTWDVELSLTQAQWELLYRHVGAVSKADGNMLSMSEPNLADIVIKFPADCVKAHNMYYYGSSEERAIKTLTDYFEDGGELHDDFTQMLTNLNTSSYLYYSDTTVELFKKNRPCWYLIAWEDSSGGMHFNKVVLKYMHTDPTPVSIQNAVPAPSHVTPDKYGHPDVTWLSEVPHVLNYYVSGDSGEAQIITGIKSPYDQAVSAKVSYVQTVGVWTYETAYETHTLTGGGFEHGRNFDLSAGDYVAEIIVIEWLDGGGNLLGAQRIFIEYNPVSYGIGAKKNYLPVPNPGFDDVLAPHINYDSEDGVATYAPGGDSLRGIYDAFSKIEIDYSTNVPIPGNVAYLESNYNINVPIPGNAAYYESRHWNSSLYAPQVDAPASYEPGSIEAKWALKTLPDAKRFYIDMGELWNWVDNQGVSLLTVEKTRADQNIGTRISFYDKDFKLIEPEPGKSGYYIYFVREGVEEETVPVGDTVPAAPVTKPVAVIENPVTGDKLLISTMPHVENEDSAIQFISLDIEYLDQDNNPKTPNGPVTIYLPFPGGMSYEQALTYIFKLFHYEDGLDNEAREIKVEVTDLGLKFASSSFSPFILSYEPSSQSMVESAPDRSGSSGHAISITRSGSSSVRTSYYSAGSTRTIYFDPDSSGNYPVAYVDGVSVGRVSSYTFENLGSDHAIYLDYAAGGVDIMIPKTGDMPMVLSWGGLLMLASGITLYKRRQK